MSLLNFETYGIKKMYKGTFLKYTDENYLINNNFEAYIAIPDLILNNPDTEILKQTVLTNNIKNKNELGIEPYINNINSIICKPLFINNVNPILENGDNVFVFIFDNDPKKIFYANINTISTETEDEIKSKYVIKVGRNSLYIDKDEIRLLREMDDINDNSITVSQYGIEVTGNRIIINDIDITEAINNLKVKEE